jgi:hypothetical protein
MQPLTRKSNRNLWNNSLQELIQWSIFSTQISSSPLPLLLHSVLLRRLFSKVNSMEMRKRRRRKMETMMRLMSTLRNLKILTSKSAESLTRRECQHNKLLLIWHIIRWRRKYRMLCLVKMPSLRKLCIESPMTKKMWTQTFPILLKRRRYNRNCLMRAGGWEPYQSTPSTSLILLVEGSRRSSKLSNFEKATYYFKYFLFH